MITAFHPKTEQWLDLDYETITEARKRNPCLRNFRYKLDDGKRRLPTEKILE